MSAVPHFCIATTNPAEVSICDHKDLFSARQKQPAFFPIRYVLSVEGNYLCLKVMIGDWCALCKVKGRDSHTTLLQGSR
jgi:hypothetical protein